MKAAHTVIVVLVRSTDSSPANLLPNAPFTGARDKLLGFQNQMPAHLMRASSGTKVRTSTS